MIGDDIEVSVLAIMGEKVRIGIEAPRAVPVFRKEVYVEIQQDRDDGGEEDVDAEIEGLSRPASPASRT
jgi:carbon storage regulator